MNDFSSQNNDGTLTGTTSVAGRRGLCRRFDGVDDTIQDATPAGLLTNTAGSVCMWVRTNTNTDTVAFSVGDADNVEVNSMYWFFRGSVNNVIRIAWNRDNASEVILETGANALTDDTWHHVVLTSSGTAYTLYVDTVSLSLSVITGSNNGNWFGDLTTPDTFVISGDQRNAGLALEWEDDIDQVLVFDRAITQAEVDKLFDAIVVDPNTGGIVASETNRLSD